MCVSNATKFLFGIWNCKSYPTWWLTLRVLYSISEHKHWEYILMGIRWLGVFTGEGLAATMTGNDGESDWLCCCRWLLFFGRGLWVFGFGDVFSEGDFGGTTGGGTSKVRDTEGSCCRLWVSQIWSLKRHSFRNKMITSVVCSLFVKQLKRVITVTSLQ